MVSNFWQESELKKNDFICENGEETKFKDALLSKETTYKYSKEIMQLLNEGKDINEATFTAKKHLEKYFNLYMKKYYKVKLNAR